MFEITSMYDVFDCEIKNAGHFLRFMGILRFANQVIAMDVNYTISERYMVKHHYFLDLLNIKIDFMKISSISNVIAFT